MATAKLRNVLYKGFVVELEYSKISVIGLGYIGLPTAATLASRGVDVVGVDVNESAVNAISKGKAHFSEPDLDMLVQSAVSTKKLRAQTTPEEADAFIIAVPTPFLDDHSGDLSYIQAAGRAIAKVLKPGNLVILESTSPVGTTQKLCEWIAQERPDLRLPDTHLDTPDIHMAYCPERILPGRMVFELVENDRIIGGMTERCTDKATALYEIFVRGELHRTNAPTAELVKIMENAYRDVNIAFANEISTVCDALNLNAWEAISLANRHPRVNILNPGPGVGGHCIAIDPWFLISHLPEKTRLMRMARKVNDAKPNEVLDKVRHQIDRFRKPIVACLGLTYKPDVDDLRESPALHIVEVLAKESNAELLVVEPNIAQLPATLTNYERVKKIKLDEALERADIIVVLVGHKKFAKIDNRKIHESVVIDTIGLWQVNTYK
ncbi:MAG: UDP-N-acetyl-D-mannosamine dehydrogenase [Robiginitomaculum sp.]|nr:UDP-N-acetyl-D-mannosamine dehydrogenase [Robiginitomaculum sp.]